MQTQCFAFWAFLHFLLHGCILFDFCFACFAFASLVLPICSFCPALLIWCLTKRHANACLQPCPTENLGLRLIPAEYTVLRKLQLGEPLFHSDSRVGPKPVLAGRPYPARTVHGPARPGKPRFLLRSPDVCSFSSLFFCPSKNAILLSFVLEVPVHHQTSTNRP